MISLKRSVQTYDDICRVTADHIGAMLSVITAVRQYAVETDPASLELFRGNLSRTIDQLQSALKEPVGAALESVPSDVRASIRDYRDRAAEYIARIRRDLEEASTGLHQLLSTMQNGDSSPEERVREQITLLESLESCTSLEQIRAQIHAVSVRLNECVEQLRVEKNATIAQLKSEIQSLHRSLEHAQRAATLDVLTGVLKRDEFERLMKRNVTSGANTGVIHIWLRDLHALTGMYPRPVLDQLLAAFSKRLRNLIPPEAAAGRWTSDVFCVILPNPLIRSICSEVAKSCGGRYACVSDGSAVSIHIQMAVTALSRREHEDVYELIKRLDLLRPEA